MDEAERLCDRIAILDGGRIVAVDTVDGLKRRVARQLGRPEVTLEDVFIELTGRPLEEEVGAQVA
jgi:ABC-2 type transport system ATP-binding protein